MSIASKAIAIAILAVGSPARPAETQAAPATAEDFTKLFADKNDRTWSGGDQMTSYKAPNGKIYWISADTILSDGEDADGSYPETGTIFVSNRVLLQDGGRFENAMASGGLAVPDPKTHTNENQERYWAQGAFWANGFLYLLCQRVIKDSTPGSIGFRFIGTEIAKYRVAADGKLAFINMVPTPSTNVPGGIGPEHIQWAADAISHGGYVYIYGYTQAPPDNPDRAAHYSYVARVPTRDVESPAAWRFYRRSTKTWVRDISGRSGVAGNVDAILDSQVSSARWIGDKLVIAHKPWNGLGSKVYAEVGSRPEGPFSAIALFDSPAGTWKGRNYQTYSPMLHPEQPLTGEDAGKILMSISWNGKDFLADVVGNADLYKPRFYAVNLP